MSGFTHSTDICTNCVLPKSFPRIEFNDKGVCSVCQEYDKLWGKWGSNKKEKRKILEKICNKAKSKNKDFDALIPLSGGKDSTYALYMAQNELGLNCLAYTLDTGYLSDYAKNNIDTTCKKLGVEHLYYCLDPELTNRLFALFMKKTGWFCSVCMRAIAMSTYRVAEMYRIPLIIKGSSMRTELPLTREMFNAGDPAHVESVLKDEAIAKECKRLCSMGASLQRKIGYLLFMLFGQKRLVSYASFNLPDYLDWNYETIERTISKELCWVAPSESEHMDCLIHPIQKYIHNRRFPNLEIRRLTLARLVMAGQITREEAIQKLEKERSKDCPEDIMKLFLNNINLTREEFDQYVDMGPRHLDYHPQSSFVVRLIKKAVKFKEAGKY